VTFWNANLMTEVSKRLLALIGHLET
jgi:hypothetical protein